MLNGLLLSLVVLRIVPALPALLLLVIWTSPALALAPLLGLAWLGRERAGSPEPALVAFHRTLGAEMRAGMSLRMALVMACREVDVAALGRAARLAAAGHPMDEVASAVGAVHPSFRATAAALRVANRSGGSAVGIFDTLMGEAVEEDAIRREQRSLTGPARLSIAIVAGFPVLALVWQTVSGDLAGVLAEGTPGTVMVGAGILLLAMGLLWVFQLMRWKNP